MGYAQTRDPGAAVQDPRDLRYDKYHIDLLKLEMHKANVTLPQS
jgi:hypothetical protein